MKWDAKNAKIVDWRQFLHFHQQNIFKNACSHREKRNVVPSTKVASPKVDTIPPEIEPDVQAKFDELTEEHILDATGELDCPNKGSIRFVG